MWMMKHAADKRNRARLAIDAHPKMSLKSTSTKYVNRVQQWWRRRHLVLNESDGSYEAKKIQFSIVNRNGERAIRKRTGKSWTVCNTEFAGV